VLARWCAARVENKLKYGKCRPGGPRPPQMGDVRDDALHLGSGLYYGIAR
jgi:hypothetical protein